MPEHPGWEDLIELENIEDEIKEIENDIDDNDMPFSISQKNPKIGALAIF